jgi:hypothetical protein
MYFQNQQIAVVFCRDYILSCFIKSNGEIWIVKETINRDTMRPMGEFKYQEEAECVETLIIEEL